MNSHSNAPAIPPDFEFAALSEARNYRRALLRDFRPYLCGKVLEVGAGIGQITGELLRMPEIGKLVSIEPESAFCDRIRNQFPEHSVHCGTVDDLPSGTDWNAILSVNVLEHIEKDGEELAAYHRLLKSARGSLCLFVPAREEIYAPIDRDFGHFRRYDRPALRKRLEAAGFTPVRFRYYNFAGYIAWWVSFCLMKKRSFDPAAVRFFDRAIFPLVHGFESHICPPPIGQSLMVLAVAN
jgi:SAM-dependent methyltransferase